MHLARPKSTFRYGGSAEVPFSYNCGMGKDIVLVFFQEVNQTYPTKENQIRSTLGSGHFFLATSLGTFHSDQRPIRWSQVVPKDQTNLLKDSCGDAGCCGACVLKAFF